MGCPSTGTLNLLRHLPNTSSLFDSFWKLYNGRELKKVSLDPYDTLREELVEIEVVVS
jgi:hypothetical protein